MVIIPSYNVTIRRQIMTPFLMLQISSETPPVIDKFTKVAVLLPL